MPFARLFDGYNAGYAQELFEQYARDPASVPPEWRAIFERSAAELEAAGLIVPDGLTENGLRGWRRGVAEVRESSSASATPPIVVAPQPGPGSAVAPRTRALSGSVADAPPALISPDHPFLSRIARASALIHAFRDHGHQLARIDPLGSEPPGHPRLDPAFFGTSMQDLAAIPTSLVLEGSDDRPLSETLERLRTIYCGSVGYQFEHLEDPAKVQWLWSEVESGRHARPMHREERLALLRRLSQVEGLERFLHRAYLGQKRFSIEGTDMLVPMLDVAIESAAASGAKEVVLGMAHRGRLNVLTHIVGVEYATLLREFEGATQASTRTPAGTGDVKYHHGARGEYALQSGQPVRITLSPNPSHLEFVGPVVGGITRFLQYGGPGKEDRRDPAAVVPILIHGDAAFAAEGVVAESLNLARLDGYTVGGTVHVIVNNQVGFTTSPAEGRSTRYASDLAKGYDIPILHVNADDPAACLAATRLAMAYRSKFGDDILIDLVGYRRFGHNEGDEPAYTQPLLYRAIEGHATVRALWVQALVEEGVLTEAEAGGMEDDVARMLATAQESVRKEAADASGTEGPEPPPAPAMPEVATGIALESLQNLSRDAFSVPDGFSPHPKLAKQLERHRAELSEDTLLDWAHAEALALGSLLQDGVPVRMTGQDTQRGTFSQRHLVLHDARTGQKLMPLAAIGTARIEVYNSPLSEAAVLGFEYGYSVAADRDLVLWEAQFGDFVNAAQVIVDQFVASGRAKWNQSSSLALLLPHGYEGQGPEHSSARLERFLQLCAEDNLRVAYPSTPAQYFHLLRRQALGTPARPLVVMTPKSLLRLPDARSRVSDLSRGGFRPILPEPRRGPEAGSPADPKDITRLVLCSGKLYYDLSTAEARKHMTHVSVARIEELHPFPALPLRDLLLRHPSVREVVWAQEEPRNMGALSYVGPHLRGVVPKEIPLKHVSRPERASPAEGRSRNHTTAQERIVREALGL